MNWLCSHKKDNVEAPWRHLLWKVRREQLVFHSTAGEFLIRILKLRWNCSDGRLLFSLPVVAVKRSEICWIFECGFYVLAPDGGRRPATNISTWTVHSASTADEIRSKHLEIGLKMSVPSDCWSRWWSAGWNTSRVAQLLQCSFTFWRPADRSDAGPWTTPTSIGSDFKSFKWR